MKKQSVLIVSVIAVLIGILIYIIGFSSMLDSTPELKIVEESQAPVSSKSLKENLDSIQYREPEEIKSTLSSDQKKKLSNLNETQQKEALSAMGHQQAVRDVVKYGEQEMQRLQESEKALAEKDQRAEEIIRSLNAQVAEKKAKNNNQ